MILCLKVFLKFSTHPFYPFVIFGSLIIITRNAIISTLPRIIRKMKSHFKPIASEGDIIPTLNPVVATADVISNKESTKLKPYELTAAADPSITAAIRIIKISEWIIS